MIKHVDKIAILVLLFLLTSCGRQSVIDASLPAVKSHTSNHNRILNETITSFNSDDEISEIGKNENSEIMNWWGINITISMVEQREDSRDGDRICGSAWDALRNREQSVQPGRRHNPRNVCPRSGTAGGHYQQQVVLP